MAENSTPELTAEQQARYQAMADWAENDMAPSASYAGVMHGADAAAHARGILVAAGMDPEELNRLIGGRPNLDPQAPVGKHSPQLNLRVTAEMKHQIVELAAEREIPASELVREILAAGVRQLRESKMDQQRSA